METKNTLNGFEAILDIMNPNVGKDNNNFDIDDAVEELTDEELEAIAKQKTSKTDDNNDDDDVDIDDDDIDDTDDKKKKTSTNKNNKDNKNTVTKTDDSDDDSDTDDDSVDNDPDEESTVVTKFFDALSEKLNWEDIEDSEKPKTAEDLVEYFKEIIEENSVPNYASEEIEKLDEFVRNGGNLRDYLQIDADINLDEIDITEDENNQKLVLREFLKEKGFNNKQIEKKLTKYEDAGLLEDEAEDALEALKEIKIKRKEQLLAEQEKQARDNKKKQQEFFNNVVAEIKGMDNIYGIDIPEKDKRALLEYIFKPDSNGITKYQKDYAKSLKNLVTSAYFTMKGDSLIDIAKKKGKRDAFDTFKQSLTKNSGVNKKSKRQIINDDDTTSIWNAFTRQLRVAQ